MLKSRLQIHLRQCHTCKDWSKVHHGGCAGPCPCLYDGKDIIWHAQRGYCPAARYPFAGLGSVLGWLVWHLRIPQILRHLRIFDPTKCKCAARQNKLNCWGTWLRGFLPRSYSAKVQSVLERISACGEVSGKMLRRRLRDHHVRLSAASFYHLMAKMEDQKLVDARNVEIEIDGHRVLQRMYQKPRGE